MPEDYRNLRQIETSGPIAHRWRLRGAVPSPEAWAQGLSTGVLAQFLVMARKDDRPIGVAFAYHPNFQDGFASFAAARFDPASRSPLMMLGVGLALDYFFTCWNFRKLYMEVAEYNYSQFEAGLGRLFEIEGRFRDHWFYDGQLWDLLTLAIYREAWEDLGPRLLAAERPEEARRVIVRVPSRPDPIAS
jgi:RimJ/RimL family protein N-acetyltransferase